MLRFTFFFCFLCCYLVAFSQKTTLLGDVFFNNTPAAYADIFIENTSFAVKTNDKGTYQINNVPTGKHLLKVFYSGAKSKTLVINVKDGVNRFDFYLESFSDSLSEIEISHKREETYGIARLNSVEGTAIYEGKKTELILINDITANLAANNPRQIFAKVPGLNIWESDGAGIQLGIGARGLSPNRTSNFNTRQNGYDISADPLGYPESYYTPPVEALERIEVVRGASSLQYGPQFGGMLNFVFKKAEEDKKISVVSRQTAGSYQFFNSFNSVSGKIAKQRIHYYTFYQRKQGEGWRANSEFALNTFYLQAEYKASKNASINTEYTYMDYLAKQAGGLTYQQFLENPRASFRDRNWFSVNWNLFSLSLNWKISDRTTLNVRNFAIYSQRQALGDLSQLGRFQADRTLIDGKYKNFGNETRLIHRYNFLKKKSVFLIGTRYYQGNTANKQGYGDRTEQANFTFLPNDRLASSDFEFPGYNAAIFSENIFNVTHRLSVTPGFRYEYLITDSKGKYFAPTFDGAGNTVGGVQDSALSSNKRDFILLGIGISYKLGKEQQAEIYANVSQNYRSITFSDLFINNPNRVIDPNLKDEKGYNADIGVRGEMLNEAITFDMSIFYLYYKDRIGFLLYTDPRTFLEKRMTTNVANSATYGIESFIEADMTKLIFKRKTKLNASVFYNIALIDARYIQTSNTAIANRKVELVPPINFRTGAALKYQNFRLGAQYSYTQKHYTDATNAVESPTGVFGIIPTYAVADISLSYFYKMFKIEISSNNVLNEKYFTRRADGYPGPGIIPADGRTFYFTLQVKF
jgi:Fe(3+) dicitrate transport protein